MILLARLFICFLLVGFFSQSAFSASSNFIIYYSDKADYTKFEKYKTIVFDSTYHPDIKPLIAKEIDVLGYLSAGEIESSRWYFKKFKDSNILLEENKNWSGSYMADIRNKEWIAFILNEIIPGIIRQGFNGIFIDTLDSSLYLEDINPDKCKGMKEAAIHLIMAIRLNYPELKIMLNRAYAILPEAAKYINMELAESLYTDYIFEKKTYGFTPEADYLEQLRILKEVRKNNPSLKIYSLDYWDKKDLQQIRKIYEIEKGNGFIPYVATVTLDEIINE